MDCEVTYEELAALAAGDLAAAREAEVLPHLADCDRCRRRLEAIRRADAALAAMQPARTPVDALLAARRAISRVLRRGEPAEIMTLDEVAEFLRISPQELGEIAEELPAFELAGHVRVRRARLIEWIQQRERDYTRQAAGSWAARAASGELQRGVL